MSEGRVERRFRDSMEAARGAWVAADAAACAARAACRPYPDGVIVPFFGRQHLVRHPDATVTVVPVDGLGEAPPAVPTEPQPVHAAVAILLLHYLLTADGTPPAGDWATFRELPGCMFYAAAFEARADGPLAQAFAAPAAGASPDAAFGAGLERFAASAGALGGEPLALADAAFRFAALPRLAMAAFVWAGDDEFPGQARVLFDAAAGHYLPPEDLAGLGEWLAQRLTSAHR